MTNFWKQKFFEEKVQEKLLERNDKNFWKEKIVNKHKNKKVFQKKIFSKNFC
jgi:hypothetical protein